MFARPRSITVIAWLFIAIGCFTVRKDVLPLIASHSAPGGALGAEGPVERWLLWGLRALAAVGGAFLLTGANWARSLLVVWMAYHVALSIRHQPIQLLVHSLLFVAVVYLLFRPEASRFFRARPREGRAEP